MNTELKIASSADVRDSQLGQDVRIWRDAQVLHSDLGSHASVGDFAIVRESKLGSFAEIGRRNTVDHAVIGQSTYTGEFCIIKYCEIGKYCAVSWNVSIGGANHDLRHLCSTPLFRVMQERPAETYASFTEEPLQIGNDVWVGAGAHILRNVTVGDGAVIAANAVVTHDVAPYAIVAGVPAKQIGQRFSDEIVEELLKLRWWDEPVERLQTAKELFGKQVDLELIRELKALWQTQQTSE